MASEHVLQSLSREFVHPRSWLPSREQPISSCTTEVCVKVSETNPRPVASGADVAGAASSVGGFLDTDTDILKSHYPSIFVMYNVPVQSTFEK